MGMNSPTSRFWKKTTQQLRDRSEARRWSVQDLVAARCFSVPVLLALVLCCFLSGCISPEIHRPAIQNPSANRAPLDFSQSGPATLAFLQEGSSGSEAQAVVVACNSVWTQESKNPRDYARLADAFAACLGAGDYVDVAEQRRLALRCVRNARAGANLEAMRVGIAHLNYADHALKRIEAARVDYESESREISPAVLARRF